MKKNNNENIKEKEKIVSSLLIAEKQKGYEASIIFDKILNRDKRICN